MQHTDDDIERAATRFEQLVDAVDPASANLERTEDLRRIAANSERYVPTKPRRARPSK